MEVRLRSVTFGVTHTGKCPEKPGCEGRLHRASGCAMGKGRGDGAWTVAFPAFPVLGHASLSLQLTPHRVTTGCCRSCEDERCLPHRPVWGRWSVQGEKQELSAQLRPQASGCGHSSPLFGPILFLAIPFFRSVELLPTSLCHLFALGGQPALSALSEAALTV